MDIDKLRHDLGKYISMQQRWLMPDAGVEELREALRQDLLFTRKSLDFTESAVEIWERFKKEGYDHNDPDLALVETSMRFIAEFVKNLDSAEKRDLERAQKCTFEISSALTRASRRRRS